MKKSQLKNLIKHIILEVQKNEMIVNKNKKPDFFDFNNVEESKFDDDNTNFQNGDKVKLRPPWAGHKKDEIFTLSQWNGKRGWIGDKNGMGWYVSADQIVKVDNSNDEMISEDIDPQLANVCALELDKMGQGQYSKLIKYCNDMKELHSYLRDRVFGKDSTTNQFIQKCLDKLRIKEQTTSLIKTQTSKKFNEINTFNDRSEKIYKDRQGGMDVYWIYNSDTGGKMYIKPENIQKYLKKGYKLINLAMNEKTLPDGRYVNDMIDSHQQKRHIDLMEEMEFNQDRYFRLKKAYNDAIKQGKKSFVFDGRKLLIDYAKYVLEYLASRFEKKIPVDEMTTSSAAGGQEGGTIRVPAWGTKNKLGSPGAIKATKKMKGWKIVKSITDEGR